MQVQRTVKRYDDDGHGDNVGLRLLLLAAVILVARALPPQTNRRRMTKRLECRCGAKILATLRRNRIRSCIACFQPFQPTTT